MAEMVSELLRSTYYLFRDTFDTISITMDDMFKSEITLEEWNLQPGCAIDEKHRVGDAVFLLEFLQKPFRDNGGSCRIEIEVEEIVGFGIDCGIQPVALVVELNHSFVNRNAIRCLAVSWL